jgi:DNA-binding response OmpR family regulator
VSVVITANVPQSDREAALSSRMDDFVSKPIQVERLLSVLLRAHAAIQSQSIVRDRPIASRHPGLPQCLLGSLVEIGESSVLRIPV